MGQLQPNDLTVDRANEMCENYPKIIQKNKEYQFRHLMHLEVIRMLTDMVVDNINCAKCPVKSCSATLDENCGDKIKRILSKRANRKITKRYETENQLIDRRPY